MIVRLSEVTKTYRKGVKALDDLSYEVREGEIFGLLGPNGSGKTTSINCLLGLLKFESGTIEIFDQPMGPDRYDLKAQIGVIPQNVAVFYELTVEENIDYFCGLYVKDKQRRKKLVDEAIEFVALGDYRKVHPNKLSGGLQRRLNIACGIAHKPRLIIFDEPTVGVDPQSRNNILEGIKRLNQEGATIIYTSHYMEEVEQLCTRVVIMDQGKPLATGTIEELKAMVNSGETVVVEIYRLDPEDLAQIQQLSNVSRAYYEDDHLTVHFEGGLHNLLNLLDYLKSREISFNRVFSQQPTLNDVFLEITGKQLRE